MPYTEQDILNTKNPWLQFIKRSVNITGSKWNEIAFNPHASAAYKRGDEYYAPHQTGRGAYIQETPYYRGFDIPYGRGLVVRATSGRSQSVPGSKTSIIRKGGRRPLEFTKYYQ